jgi:hypothetical protein
MARRDTQVGPSLPTAAWSLEACKMPALLVGQAWIRAPHARQSPLCCRLGGHVMAWLASAPHPMAHVRGTCIPRLRGVLGRCQLAKPGDGGGMGTSRTRHAGAALRGTVVKG